MDQLRLAVRPLPPEAGHGLQVEIYVNDVEVTALGAGLGMDPYDVLVPINRFVAGPEPTRLVAARCTCGEVGCGSTELTMVRQGDVVRWNWLIGAPVDRQPTFAADAYHQEVERVAADRSWETPDRTVGRLVLESVDPARLPEGVELHWVAPDWSDPGRFQVSLMDRGRQVILGFDWADRTPAELAAEIRHTLHEVPRRDWRG
jgi:hypothetical protein